MRRLWDESSPGPHDRHLQCHSGEDITLHDEGICGCEESEHFLSWEWNVKNFQAQRSLYS
jgi:hypothetical protein